ncbi:histone-lysine N-methyltransferase SUV39H1 isoform X2 [Alligator mississippiensis]|uniref:Histone-lysine N-methyltransferase n=1 Tax=Alligator mississippiensis TaxID=8496 RepID=A0A151M491_ALLMI|nr:histone-lysine N-methyltransferase SUV39H1 isoform X2 [Alligator mississippiensis]KYO19270.1 histone-lysine N-methyltransferase SUV39H1 [Alligator mississippiensis]
MAENLKGCSVYCKSSWVQLQDLCRLAKVVCPDLGVTRRNLSHFEVEYLCDYKRVREEEFYLVKWRGYPESESTWEPRKNLRCPGVLKQFHQDLEAALQRWSRPGRPRRPPLHGLEPLVAAYLLQKAKQRRALWRWECQLNAKRSHRGRITVENEVDLDGPPRDFIYINEYKKGIRYDLCIFRTDNGRGWGVRTLEKIRKNTFVMEYVGEIITSEEAERRGQIYDRQGATYLFDLDYVEDVYTVDAAYYGNISHFVNHSCDPNLQVYNVFIDNLDERLPRIALFATRPIRAGEELTFDYNMHVDPVDAESTRMDSNLGLAGGLAGSPKKRLRIECKCGAPACRKYLF